jgi:RNAse (barnase) inhibitor barstar
MQLVENVLRELEFKKDKHQKKVDEINLVIEEVKKSNFDNGLFEIKIKSILVWDGGKDVSLLRRGKLEDVLKEAFKEFKRINNNKKIPERIFYKVYLFIERPQRKT